MSDIRTESARLVLKGLAVLLIGFCLAATCFMLWGIWFVAHPTNKGRVFELVCRVIASFLVGGPAAMGIGVGVQGLLRSDGEVAKRLVGTCCICLVIVLGGAFSTYLADPDKVHRNDLNSTAALFSAMGCLCGVGVIVYVLFGRWLLRSLESDCPRISEFIPRWPIGLMEGTGWVLALRSAPKALDTSSPDQCTAAAICVCGISAGLLFRKVVSWLEGRQKARAGLPEREPPRGLGQA